MIYIEHTRHIIVYLRWLATAGQRSGFVSICVVLNNCMPSRTKLQTAVNYSSREWANGIAASQPNAYDLSLRCAQVRRDVNAAVGASSQCWKSVTAVDAVGLLDSRRIKLETKSIKFYLEGNAISQADELVMPLTTWNKFATIEFLH